MAFISTGLLLCSMPKPWQRYPLPIIHSLPIPERVRAGWLPSTLAPGVEETMCCDMKRWKQSWGCKAPNRCIPWGDNGAKSHLARKHMQVLRREAWAGVCLPSTELREGQGIPFRNLKVCSLNTKTNPLTLTVRPLHIPCVPLFNQLWKDELWSSSSLWITNRKRIFKNLLILMLHHSLCLVIWEGREAVRLSPEF